MLGNLERQPRKQKTERKIAMQPILTQEEYNNKPASYRGIVDGKPYLVYMDENGTTIYGPVTIITSPIRSLTCCCCSASTRGRQWYNRDTGFGLCPKCAAWIATRETPEAMQENYGAPNVHYFTKGE